MRVEVEFPLDRWVKVTGIMFYGNAKTDVEEALNLHEARYGRRIRDYLHMLVRAVGEERTSSLELRPPFAGEQISWNRYMYQIDGHIMLFRDNGAEK